MHTDHTALALSNDSLVSSLTVPTVAANVGDDSCAHDTGTSNELIRGPRQKKKSAPPVRAFIANGVVERFYFTALVSFYSCFSYTSSRGNAAN